MSERMSALRALSACSGAMKSTFQDNPERFAVRCPLRWRIGQPEIQDLDLTVLPHFGVERLGRVGQNQIMRLDVAVIIPCRKRVATAGGLPCVGNRPCHRERPSVVRLRPDCGRERTPSLKNATINLLRIERGDNVRMNQLCGRLDFTAKSLDGIGVRNQIGRITSARPAAPSRDEPPDRPPPSRTPKSRSTKYRDDSRVPTATQDRDR